MNIKLIYLEKGREITEVISKEEAIRLQHAVASKHGYTYADDDDALQDMLCCPTVEVTDMPIGKIIGDYLVNIY